MAISLSKIAADAWVAALAPGASEARRIAEARKGKRPGHRVRLVKRQIEREKTWFKLLLKEQQ